MNKQTNPACFDCADAIMGNSPKWVTPQSSEDEEGKFTDGDFGDSDDATVIVPDINTVIMPVNETVNVVARNSQVDIDYANGDDGSDSGTEQVNNGHEIVSRRSSNEDYNPSIVGIIGNQHNHVSYNRGFAKNILYYVIYHCYPT